MSLVARNVRAYWSKIIVVPWVLENENGQRARGRGSHSAGEMVLAKEKGRERKGLAGRGRRVIENSRLRTIKTYLLRLLQ